MIITKWTSPDGQTYDCLPKSWHNSSPITERFALVHGWVKYEETAADPVPVLTYSKYKLHLTLGMQDLWDDFWNALDESQKQLWADCQELKSDDPFFAAALAGIKEHLRNR